jgi:hypothetical protein
MIYALLVKKGKAAIFVNTFKKNFTFNKAFSHFFSVK